MLNSIEIENYFKNGFINIKNVIDKNEINNIFIKLIKIIKNFNEIECIKLQNKYPDIY